MSKWLSVCLRTKWLWVRIMSLSLKFQIWRLLRARSSLAFRQTIECGLTLKLILDMIITYNHIVLKLRVKQINRSQRYDDKAKRPKPQVSHLGILSVYAFCWKINQRALGPGEALLGYVFVYDITPKTWPHLPPKNCHNFI